MWTQIRLEAFKLSRRLRSYIGFFSTIAITSLVALGLHYESPDRMVDRMSGGQFMMVGHILNASFLARTVMPMLFLFFMPLFVSLIAGDMIAGEAGDGTLRTQLTKPVRRIPFLLSKYIVAVIYSFVLTLFLGVFAYALGAILFGQGALVSIDPDHGIALFPKAEGLWRLGLGYALAAVGMLAIATIAFFLSTLVANSLGPVGISVMLLIGFSIIGVIPYFHWLKPYLFTTHMDLWRYAFVVKEGAVPVPLDQIQTSLLGLLAYISVFLAGSILVFMRKDIQT